MALDLPTLVQKVRVDADTKGAEDQVSNSMTRIGSSVTKVGIGVTAGVTVPIIGMAAASVSAASDLAESNSKVGVVFEENAEKVREFARTAATELGISEQKALEAAGTFGNLFRALGVGSEAAAGMSTELVTLAADLASFNNANPEDVLLALRSGLLGEAEPLRQFGVSLSAARIEAEALASGLVKPVANATKAAEASLKVKDANEKAAKALKDHGKESLEYQKASIAATKAEEAYAAATAGTVPELTAAQKAQAAYAIIQQDTALAQGDFARTSDGLANQQRILAAQFQDTKAQLGEALLPTAQKMIGVVNKLLGGFKGLSPEMRKVVTVVAGLAAAAGPLLIVGGQLVRSFGLIKGAIGGGSFLLGLGPLLPVVAAVAAAGFLLYKNWDKVKPVFEKIVGGAKQLLGIFKDRDFTGGPLAEDSPIVDFAFKVRDAFTETLIPAVRGFIGVVKREAPPILATIRSVLGGVVSFLTGTVFPVVVKIATGVGEQIGNLVGFFQEIAPQVREALSHVSNIIENVMRRVRTVIETVLGVLAALWRAWGDDLLAIGKAVFGTIQEVIGAAVDFVANIIRTGLAIINGDWGKAWDGIKGMVGAVWDGIFGILRGAVETVRGIVGGIVSTVGEVLRPLGNFLHTWVVEPFEGVLDFIGKLPGRITTLASGMWDGIKSAFKGAINWIIDAWNGLEFKIPGFDPPGPGPKFGGFTLGLPQIDRLALGGRSTPGQPFFAGERGVELVTGETGSAQVLSADRTERLLRQIAGGVVSSGPAGDTIQVDVETVDRPSGERLGRDIAWGISSARGRPLVGAGRRG